MMFAPLPMLTECMSCGAMIRDSEPSKARHAAWHKWPHPTLDDVPPDTALRPTETTNDARQGPPSEGDDE